MTEEERKELEALQGKDDLTEEEKRRVEELKAKSDSEDDDDGFKENPDFQKILEERIKQELKPMKENMNRMAKERDEAQKEAAKLKEKRRAEEIQSLEEAGKHEEAFKARITDLEAERDGLKDQLTNLTRNQTLNDALGTIEGKEFRHARAKEMAFETILPQLVQDKDGQWMHKSGVSIKDYVSTFVNSDDYEFLFKKPQNQGAGVNNSGKEPGGMDLGKDGIRGIRDPQKLMQLAAQGKLGKKTL